MAGKIAKKVQITKFEGVQRAQAELGKDVKPLAIQAFVKKTFGIEISTAVISAYKKELAKRAARARPTVQRSAAQTKAATKPATKSTGMTKQDAVRKALGTLGRNAKPLQIQSFVKEQFGIEMSADHVSTSKGMILRKRKGKGKKVAAQTNGATEPQVRPAAAPHANGKPSGISFGDIETAKDLVGRVGAEGLRKLIDLLAR